MTEENKREKEKAWRKQATTQFCMRFLNSTGVPDAIVTAAQNAKESTSEYIKRAVVMRLENDGFVQQKDIVLNLNKARHIENLQRLRKYLEEEENKLK